MQNSENEIITSLVPGKRIERSALAGTRDLSMPKDASHAPVRTFAEFVPGRCSITIEPTVKQTRKQTTQLIHDIAESMTCAMNEHLRDRRDAKLRAEQKAAEMQKLRAEQKAAEMQKLRVEKKAAEMQLKEDLIRMFEQCKQAGAVVDVSAADVAPDLHQRASEHLSSECLPRIPLRRHALPIIPRGSPGLSSTTGASSLPRAREGLAQRIAAMQLLGQKDCASAVDPGDRLQPEDPAGSRSPVGSPLANISLQDDCGGQVLDRRKGGWGGLLSGACHRASMFIPRMRGREIAPLLRSAETVLRR
jgi:hypothetical protein